MVKAKVKRRGFMFVLSSPSGAGKTTISKLLLEQDQNLVMSISATTRPPRPQEQEAVDYYFISEDQFKADIEAEKFIEYAYVFGHYYGTPRHVVEDWLNQGMDVLFDIDWQGTKQVEARMPNDLVSVFILPPSITELERRLRGRGSDSEEVIQRRMSKAHHEISHYDAYEYVMVNYSIESSLEKVGSILRAERLRRIRQHGLADLVQELLTHGL